MSYTSGLTYTKTLGVASLGPLIALALSEPIVVRHRPNSALSPQALPGHRAASHIHGISFVPRAIYPFGHGGSLVLAGLTSQSSGRGEAGQLYSNVGAPRRLLPTLGEESMDAEKSDQMDMFREMAQVSGPIETQEGWTRRVSTEEFKSTNKATRVWVSENQPLREMHEIAVEDYVTSRHAVLDLGLLRTGLALAAQAVEKFLKCYLLAGGLTIEDTRKYNHKIHALLEKAHESSTQKELLSYSGFCKELEKWYNSRYPDSLNPASQWMRSAVPEFDKFVYYLEEFMPIPPTVMHLKYGGGEMGNEWSSIFVRLFGATSSQHRAALANENAPLISRLDELEKKFFLNRLAAAMPATTLKESMEHSNRVQTVIRKYENK